MANGNENYRNIRREDVRYKPYVLKRLTDDEPYEKRENIQNVITEKQVKDDIFRNIEMLFYSRSHPSQAEFKGREDIENSVLGYGITDYCGKLCTDDERAFLLEHIKKQIRVFEPRLAPDSVEVEYANPDVAMRSLLELRISGRITVKQVDEEILFVSRLDLETGNASLSYAS
ncbi:MAG: type VI secretion system baseplate subunit TssE [Treponema sp.]|jgi:type VI secretion system lysozyme-like protein|nr:type VI secretion system baseplate subunit TssE [Treponema sp.]